MPQNDQGLHRLQIDQPFFFRNIYVIKPDIPKIENGLFQYIVLESLFSLSWIKGKNYESWWEIRKLIGFEAQENAVMAAFIFVSWWHHYHLVKYAKIK